jgi:acetoin utilization deacetylase AcuC-like enzyme
MRIVYSPRYAVDIGPHVFPTLKYRMVHARLLETGVVQPADVVEPAPARWDELALVHTTEYLTNMRDGTLSPEDIAQLELPWSVEMVDGFRVMVGGTIQAATIACANLTTSATTNPKSQIPNPESRGVSLGRRTPSRLS